MESLKDGVLRKVNTVHLTFNYYTASISDLGNVISLISSSVKWECHLFS